jgi:DNA-binding SARP family transcriptional activator
MKDALSASICLRVLGAFEVVLDGVVIPEDAWPRRKTRSLLKVLLTAPGDVFTVDQLIDALLPNPKV